MFYAQQVSKNTPDIIVSTVEFHGVNQVLDYQDSILTFNIDEQEQYSGNYDKVRAELYEMIRNASNFNSHHSSACVLGVTKLTRSQFSIKYGVSASVVSNIYTIYEKVNNYEDKEENILALKEIFRKSDEAGV